MAIITWLKNKDIVKPQKATEFLKQRIQTIFNESNEIYGSIRVQKKLKREGLIYSSSYIAQLMKKMGLKFVLPIVIMLILYLKTD